jgi:hypothetical protein
MKAFVAVFLRRLLVAMATAIVASGTAHADELTIENLLATGARRLQGAEIKALVEGSTFDGIKPNYDRIVCRYFPAGDVQCRSYAQKYAQKGSTTSGKWLISSDFLCHEQETGRTTATPGGRNCRFVLTKDAKVFLFWRAKRDHAATGVVKPGTLDVN